MNLYAIMLMPSLTQTLVILLFLVLLFGGRKIPELMKGLGSGIRQFKDAVKDDEDKDKEGAEKKDTEE